MKALVYHGPHQMLWENWPDPEPGANEVLVKVLAVGICGSDLRGYIGESHNRTGPLIMGHEATGEVIALGANVPEQYLGMRVVIKPDLICGSCEACHAGQENYCRSRQLIGVHVQGAMAQILALPVRNLLPLPANVSFAHGTLVEPLAVGLRAVNRAGDVNGKSILIAGSGPIGLLTLVAARHSGVGVIISTDVASTRLQAATTLGADAAFNPTQPGWGDQLVEKLGVEAVDIAFDAVGIPATLRQCLQLVKHGGVVVAIGGWRSIEIQMNQLVRKEIDLRGTFNYTTAEFEKACQWLEDGSFDPNLLVTHSKPMSEGADTFAYMAKNYSEGIKFILTQEAIG